MFRKQIPVDAWPKVTGVRKDLVAFQSGQDLRSQDLVSAFCILAQRLAGRGSLSDRVGAEASVVLPMT